MDLIPITDLKQWAYCPRVVYYHHVMPASAKPTYKMREGLAAQEMIEGLEMRRKLREYGLEAARRRFGVWLENQELGLSGKIDLLLEGPEEIAVVDFKLTSGEPGQNHRIQLAGYSLLGEETTIYLHLSQKHLGETASPLDALSLSPAPANDRPRSKK